MAHLSEWLQIMLAEIARKQEEAQRIREDEQRNRRSPSESAPEPKYLSTRG